MMKRLLTKVLQFNGVAIFVGVTGFAGSIVTMFVNTNATVSVKWLIASIYIALVLIVLLVKVAYEAFMWREPSVYVTPVRYLADELALLAKWSPLFTFNTVVTIYRKDGDIEREVGVGHVYNVIGTRLLHIRIIDVFTTEGDARTQDQLGRDMFSDRALKTFVIRPTIPYRLVSGSRSAIERTEI